MGILVDKSFSLAIEIVQLYKYLVEEKREYVMSKQLLRSGTSVAQEECDELGVMSYELRMMSYE